MVNFKLLFTVSSPYTFYDVIFIIANILLYVNRHE